MYINRSTNPDKPEYIGIRASSKQEGYHWHLHGSLPGNSYSPVLPHPIITLSNQEWSGISAVRNGGSFKHNFHACDLWQRVEVQWLLDQHNGLKAATQPCCCQVPQYYMTLGVIVAELCAQTQGTVSMCTH